MEHKPQNVICQNCKKDFTIEPDDFSFYEKIKVPPPTFCPMCRAQRRMAFRNERKLFKTKDAFTGVDIFSLYPPSTERKIITQDEWFGDSWDPMDYGRDYDFTKNFFVQFFKLNKEVPIYALNVKLMENSPYSGNATALKNCYLCFGSNYSENCMYGNGIDYSKDCVDNSHINHAERCYECFWLQNCYQCYFTTMSVESQNLWFCRDCLGCNDCFGCTNLRKSSHCIFNKQYTKEEYFKILADMKLDTREGIENARAKARAFWKTQINKFHQGLKNLNSTGSYVTNCKNVNESYLVRESENVRYSQYMSVPKNKDCFDYSVWGQHSELCYETSVCGEYAYNLKFSWDCWPNVRDCEYSAHLKSCSDCFGCVSLKNKQYCVFNKQYTKEEYFKLREKIIEQMNINPYIDSQGLKYMYGEFFPIEFSPFGYNNTLAVQHFILNKEEAERKGYSWVEEEPGKYTITKKTADIPNSIENVGDEIINEVLGCEKCGKPFRILMNELTFLKNEKLPIPDCCSECRHEQRIADRFKIFLYNARCMCKGSSDVTGNFKNTTEHHHGSGPCEEKIITGFDPKNNDIVYCEKCYQQEVY